MGHRRARERRLRRVPQGASRTTNVNDIASLSLVDIHFSGSSTVYTISGNAITLTGSIVDDPLGNTTISFNIAIPATVIIKTTDTNSRIFLSGVISGAGGISTTGSNGEMHLSGANTYDGAVTGNGGYVVVENATALGSTVGGTTINAGSTLHFSVTGVPCEAFSITGFGQSGNGALQIDSGAVATFACNFTVPAGGASISSIAPGVFTMTGQISGAGDVRMGGDGVLVFANSGNNWTGGLSYLNPFNGTIRLGASNAIPSNVQLNVLSSDTFDVNGFANTIAAISGPGTLALGTGLLTLNQSANTSFDGPVTGTGNLVKQGSGILTFTGPRAGGGATVNAGSLFLDSTWGSTLVGVGGTGILGGTGGAGNVAVLSGALAPGHSPGHFSAVVATFSGGTFAVELNGLVAGTQYDQLEASGGVQLTGATLSASLGFAAPNGTQFTIIQNDGPAAVVGTFTGLPEGASFLIGGSPFTISYVGGDGNDVVLTAGAAAVPAMRPMIWMVLAIATLGAAALMLRRRGALA